MSSPTFVIVSFEGPDRYAHAGGLGTRVTELSRALAGAGFETHLFFIGDPDLPGHEIMAGGKLHLHRWCQWISRYHPAGVYDGEAAKHWDWERSLPAWLERDLLSQRVDAGGHVVVLGEEWQAVAPIVALADVVRRRRWAAHVHLVWNANNTFSFERINWRQLKAAATITTVSRYMKHIMWGLGVDAEVVPNGIPEHWLQPVSRRSTQKLPQLFGEKLALVKVARWDPDKRWDMAVDAVAAMKDARMRPLFLAKGGMEAHGYEVWARAQQRRLDIKTIDWRGPTVDEFTDALEPALGADMVVLQGYLSEPQRRALFRSAHAVLANSGREPFGLVGLETMAVGGIAMVGSTGEDYVTPGHDAISLQTNDPLEIVSHVGHLVSSPETEAALRVEAKRSAARYSWPVVIRRVLLPFLARLGVPASPSEPGAWEATTGYPTQIRPLGPAQALPQERAASEPARLHVPREPLKGLPASVA